MMSHPEAASRLLTELELLEAMYPGQTLFDSQSRDLKFRDESSGSLLHLRIPEQYPIRGLPDVMAASGRDKRDLRDEMKAAIHRLGLPGGTSGSPDGEEALDAIIACFQNMMARTDKTEDDSQLLAEADTSTSHAGAQTRTADQQKHKTVVIWLHHLLAQSKRKLAVSPAGPVAGVSKPGYPGIMVFTGRADAVTEHVNTLKAQNWQAFQVRYEEDVLWEFGHAGVEEVESMAGVVKRIEAGEGGAQRKEEFLKAAGIK